ncbi:MAG TPA: saccharopine dehydrogenase C-terminal domain-containing protein [Pyrinomonadaceae bacterium]|nr:saccharopine dehydrogenase C-terminal domain-containing protein [Pyrinomonadaceae bacterium]
MKILVIGGGRMGFGAVFDLIYNSPAVEAVTVADYDSAKIEKIAAQIDSPKLRIKQIDVSNYTDVIAVMRGHHAAISCVNYWFNFELSKAAIETGTNFCDLGGNNSVVEEQLALDEKAKNAGINIVPDCGLAPGMVSILAARGANRFDETEAIHIRVGGLPQNPRPPLDYQLIFSVEGLINEYVEKARVIRNSKIEEVESMSELETLAFENFPALEAFQTSGGTSTLPESFLGKIKELDYKTIRYNGHCAKFKTMIDLGLCSSEEIAVDDVRIKPRKIFGELLQKALPADEPDYVLVRLEFVGIKDGEKKRLRYDIIDEFNTETNLSAMMRTTAFPASIIAQMTAKGETFMRGSTPQEKAIDAEKFVAELAKRNIKVKEIYS